MKRRDFDSVTPLIRCGLAFSVATLALAAFISGGSPAVVGHGPAGAGPVRAEDVGWN